MADPLAHLVPFGAATEPGLVLRASVERASGRLALRYVVGGPVGSLRLSPRAAAPSRKDELWKQTCFEAFLAPAGDSAYWEINLSTSGDWNVYRFDGERTGMRPETRVTAAVTELERASCGTITLGATLDLEPLPELTHAALDASLAAVLEQTDGTRSYWSIVHDANRPDFHRRESFVVRLTTPAGARASRDPSLRSR